MGLEMAAGEVMEEEGKKRLAKQRQLVNKRGLWAVDLELSLWVWK